MLRKLTVLTDGFMDPNAFVKNNDSHCSYKKNLYITYAIRYHRSKKKRR